jgi:hypothetical protein
MRARVKNGRWVLDDPTDLPDRGRPFVTPVDIKNAAPAVLRRFVKADEHVQAILDQTPVP